MNARCGPDGCPIVTYDMLSVAEKRRQRKDKARVMIQRGFTETQIAKQFGVTHATISTDLREFVNDLQTQPRTSKRGRINEGRPIGSRKSTATPGRGRAGQAQIDRAAEQALASEVLDNGKSLGQAAKEAGLASDMVARFAVAREQGRREAELTITPEMLSITAQQKLETAIRQHKRILEMQFKQRVLEEVRKRVDEIVLPSWKKNIDEAQQLYKRRRGLMDKETFNIIRRALHPDSRNSISDRKLGEAFNNFMALEKYLLDEKDSPTTIPDVPSNLAAWDKAKQAATAERKARRQAGNLPRRA